MPGAVAARRPRPCAAGGLALALAAVAAGCVSGPPASLRGLEPQEVVSPTTRGSAPTTTTATPAAPTTAASSGAGDAAGAEWTLLAVGDVLMDDTEAAGVDPFAGVVPPLASGDVAVVNVEMAVASGGVAEPKTYAFRAPPSAAARLAAAGVEVANLANNHSLDFGVGGLLETVGNLRAAGVAPVGAGASAADAFAPALLGVGAVRVAVLGASRVFPRRDWAARDGPGIASAYDERTLLGAVRAARAQADVVVVAVHWGREGSPCPDEDQVRQGEALLDAGASVVLGSHPHVLQPVVADGRGVLAYSLGNFVFHRRWGATGESGVLEVRFAGARVVGHRLHPHVLHDGPPRPAGPASAARIAAAVAGPCPAPTPPAPSR